MDGQRSGYGVCSFCASPELYETIGIDVHEQEVVGWIKSPPYSPKWVASRLGWVYAGQMKQGKRHGFGALASGEELYEGQFSQDWKNGFGTRMVRDQELWLELHDDGECRLSYNPLRREDLTVNVGASFNRVRWLEAKLLLSWNNGVASITIYDKKTGSPVGARAMIPHILSLKIGDPVTHSFILQYRDPEDCLEGKSSKLTLEIQAGSSATFRLVFLALRLAIHEQRSGRPLVPPLNADWFQHFMGSQAMLADTSGPDTSKTRVGIKAHRP